MSLIKELHQYMTFASLEYDYQSLSARYAGFCIYSFGKNSLLARGKDVGNVVMIDVWPRRDTAGRAAQVSLKFKVFVCRWGCVSFSRVDVWRVRSLLPVKR